MVGEVPAPEANRAPEGSVFDLDLLMDDQVIWLNRALYAQYERDNAGVEGTVLANGFLDMFEGAIEELTRRDPERGKVLLREMAGSTNEHDREMAAQCAPVLAEHDYEGARDMIIALSSDSVGIVWDTAVSAAEKLVGRVAPEQAADFEARWQQHIDG